MDQVILNKKYRIIDSKFSAKVGSYGAVYKAVNIDTKQIVAVKEIKRTIGNQGIQCTVLRETAILNFLDNKNIVMLIQSFIIDGVAYLVFPYFEMNLRQFIKKQYDSKVPPTVVKKIMCELLTALKTAHTARFMHRDVKFQNILVQKSKESAQKFTIKLADWGASRKFTMCSSQSFTDYVIPRVFRPPELLFELRNYTESVDIWSLGCLFYELLLGQRAFPKVSANQLLVAIQKKIGLSESSDEKWLLEMYNAKNFEFPEKDRKNYRVNFLEIAFQQKFGNVPVACDLLKKMLRINPEKRISASDSLKHPYFDFNN